MLHIIFALHITPTFKIMHRIAYHIRDYIRSQMRDGIHISHRISYHIRYRLRTHTRDPYRRQCRCIRPALPEVTVAESGLYDYSILDINMICIYTYARMCNPSVQRKNDKCNERKRRVHNLGSLPRPWTLRNT